MGSGGSTGLGVQGRAFNHVLKRMCFSDYLAVSTGEERGVPLGYLPLPLDLG